MTIPEPASQTPRSHAGDGRVPRLIARLYRQAAPSARAGVLAGLMRPLGLLGLAAVASGAFAGFAGRRRAPFEVGLDEVGRFTTEQVLDLARFVEQVDDGVLEQIVHGVVTSPAGFTAFGVAAAWLVLRRHGRSRG